MISAWSARMAMRIRLSSRRLPSVPFAGFLFRCLFLLQPLRLDLDAIGVVELLLLLVAQAAEAGPVALLAVLHGLDQLEVDPGTRFLDDNPELMEKPASEAEFLQPSQIREDLFEGLI